MLRIEAGEDVAQMVMGWRAVAKGPKPPQHGQLPVAEAGDVGDRCRTGQHGEQAKQQHLLERIHHLRARPMVRQFFEIAKKNNRLGDRLAISAPGIHRIILPPSRGPDRFTIAAPCHPFIHPIALTVAGSGIVGAAGSR